MQAMCGLVIRSVEVADEFTDAGLVRTAAAAASWRTSPVRPLY